MHSSGNDFVFAHLPGKAQLTGIGGQTAAKVGRYAAGDNQTHTTQRPLLVEVCQFLKTALFFFQPGMHGTHEYPVSQLGKPQIQGF